MNLDPRARAVVIGAGIGGLSAAAALSPYFGNVLILERDLLPSSAISRSGTPQDRHPHVLLRGGLQALDDILPGFGEELSNAGAVSVNMFRDLRYERPDVGALPQRDLGVDLLSATRPLIEHLLRQRVASLPNVTLQSQCRVTALLPPAPNTTRPHIHFDDGMGAGSVLQADLVVDASGRAAPTLALLDALGWDHPGETVVGVDVRYTSAVLPWPAASFSNWKLVTTLADPPDLVMAGLLLPLEGERCIVAVAEHGGSKQAESWEEFLLMLRRLKTSTIYDAIRHLPPPDRLRHFVFEESRWRHFEKLSRLPEGILPFADCICRFNPIYGQGMSVAARQAKLLHDILRRVAAAENPISAVQSDFMSEMGSLLQAPWNIGVNADFAYLGTRGTRPENYEEGRKFEAALFRAAVADPIVQSAFCDVVQLVKPFDFLQSPDIGQRINGYILA